MHRDHLPLCPGGPSNPCRQLRSQFGGRDRCSSSRRRPLRHHAASRLPAGRAFDRGGNRTRLLDTTPRSGLLLSGPGRPAARLSFVRPVCDAGGALPARYSFKRGAPKESRASSLSCRASLRSRNGIGSELGERGEPSATVKSGKSSLRFHSIGRASESESPGSRWLRSSAHR